MIILTYQHTFAACCLYRVFAPVVGPGVLQSRRRHLLFRRLPEAVRSLLPRMFADRRRRGGDGAGQQLSP